MAEQTGFEGRWDVAASTLPTGASAYTGAIDIARTGTVFALDWQISDGHYVGVGLLAGEHLFVSCGEQLAGLGIALFQPSTDGVAIQWTTAELGQQTGSGSWESAWNGSFEGEHAVSFALPDGRIYGEWTLAIRRNGQIYELSWRRRDGIHLQGIGLDTPLGIAAGWYPDTNQLAFLDYTLGTANPSQLSAVWALGGHTTLGSETLRRITG